MKAYEYFHNLAQLFYESSFRNYKGIHIEQSVISIIANYALFYQSKHDDTFVSFKGSFERGVVNLDLVKNASDLEYLKKDKICQVWVLDDPHKRIPSIQQW